MPRRRQTRSAAMPEHHADAHPHAAPVRVRIFERPSHRTLIVSWREAGRCCYCEQSWELTAAPAAGTCALSGQFFAEGERVFKPAGDPAPINHEACIAERSVADWAELGANQIG